MIFINCVIKTTIHRYNSSSYKKEQFKLHRSCLGVKGGPKQPSEQPYLQRLAVTGRSIFLGQLLVKSMTNSTNTLQKCI